MLTLADTGSTIDTNPFLVVIVIGLAFLMGMLVWAAFHPDGDYLCIRCERDDAVGADRLYCTRCTKVIADAADRDRRRS